MFCPRCSQEQISEEIKFCSRCGFPLGLVSELLAHNGLFPQLAQLGKGKKFLTRKNGLIFSLLWFMFFTMLMAPIAGMENGNDAATMALFGTIGGLILLIMSFAFLKNEPKNTEKLERDSQAYELKNLRQSEQTALPPMQSQSAQSYVSPANSWRAPNTGELVQSQSVTEGTTKLLKKEK